ncbi:MAG: hypothetical protein Q4G27_09755 [Flavobacteriaceae bacterium]|nr:hypothetical protein [Flavobacteriaceae bacterium]
MNWEYLIIGFLFLAALIYIWKKLIIPFTSKRKSDCSSGCCSVDFSTPEKKK